MDEVTGAWTVGDTAIPLSGVATLDDKNVPLDTAVSGEAWVRRPDRTVFHNPVDFLLTDGVGRWSSTLKTGDLTIPGPHVMEIRVVWGDDTVQTFGPDVFPVRPRIGT